MIQLGHIGLNVRYSLTDKPGIIFLHFSGGNLHMWDGIVPQFNKDYSIIAPDLRGHGKSDKPATGLSYRRYGKRYVSLIEETQRGALPCGGQLNGDRGRT
ncbi:MAG: alpha/beta fold hydrolase [Bacillota bacterium]